MDVLQLSPDIGVDRAWFARYEVSEYFGSNHLDLENIDRPEARYDLVICNHVLEHVADDRRGFRELLRITRPDGLVQITVPSPYTQAKTVDWGFPRAESHGHYRGYGRDLIERFMDAASGVSILEIDVLDPVTGDGGYVYFCGRRASVLRDLATRYPKNRLHEPSL